MAEEEEERVVLTQEMVASSLSQVARTIDGASFAFTKLDLAGRSLSDIGTVLAAYEHLRYINLSKNRIADAASLIHIKSLLALNLRQNALQRLPPFANPYLQVRLPPRARGGHGLLTHPGGTSRASRRAPRPCAGA